LHICNVSTFYLDTHHANSCCFQVRSYMELNKLISINKCPIIEFALFNVKDKSTSPKRLCNVWQTWVALIFKFKTWQTWQSTCSIEAPLQLQDWTIPVVLGILYRGGPGPKLLVWLKILGTIKKKNFILIILVKQQTIMELLLIKHKTFFDHGGHMTL
jgi:hypothetical protein